MLNNNSDNITLAHLNFIVLCNTIPTPPSLISISYLYSCRVKKCSYMKKDSYSNIRSLNMITICIFNILVMFSHGPSVIQHFFAYYGSPDKN